ncbi:hypothetical protein [Leifsonia sp. NPDC058248]|uniref:hypothetical protein n=1 Tax=Leifsonia sp. NPDC058248 TaxID=3346402 RepID=UPI0036DFA054
MLDLPSWLITWLHTVSLWDIVLWLLVAGGIVLFVKKGWPALRRFAVAILSFAKMVDAVAGLPAFIKRTDATLTAQDLRIAEIHHETHKNDGSSIKDSSDRTEAAVARVEEGVAGLHGRMDEVERSVKELGTEQVDLRHDFENTHPRSDIEPPNPKETP